MAGAAAVVDAFRIFDGAAWDPVWLCEQAEPGAAHRFLGLTLKRRTNWLAGDKKEGFRVVNCMLDRSTQPPLLRVLTPLMLCSLGRYNPTEIPAGQELKTLRRLYGPSLVEPRAPGFLYLPQGT